MSGPGATPLFVDTGPYYARFVENAPRHARASAVFEGIAEGALAYRPLYTSTYVLDELATLVLRRKSHAKAVDTLDRIRSSTAFTVIHPDAEEFATACDQFAQYDDQQISFTDHVSGALADDRDVAHVFTFDPDDFRTLGFVVVPDDTGEP